MTENKIVFKATVVDHVPLYNTRREKELVFLYTVVFLRRGL